MVADEWVKCHSALMRGAKRAIPRASRFVFLELCLHARALDGSVELRADVPVHEAMRDLLGGDAAEAATALAHLSGAGMVRAEQADGAVYLVIPSWERWNRPDTSSDRVKRHRAKRREPIATDVTHVTLQPVTHETAVTFQPVTGCNDVNAIEERRVEEIRGEERERAPAATPTPTAAPLSVNGRRVADQIASHRDLFAMLTAGEVSPFVGRIDREIGKLERVDVWTDLESEVDSWVSYARSKSEERSQTPTQLLGLVENLARTRCRERPAKARIEREKRRDEQARATTWPDGKAKSPAALETHDLDAEIAEADRKLAADRAKRDAEPKVDPAKMAELTRKVLARFGGAV